MISVADLRDHDVVCGRSTVTHSHVGNKNFRSLIQEHGFQYQSTPLRSIKKSTAMGVINAIQMSGGRFLKVAETESKNSPDTFEVADADFIYEKCSHALRSYRPTRYLKRASKPKKTNSPNTKSSRPTTSTPIVHNNQVSSATFLALYETQQRIFRLLQAESCFNENSAGVVVTLNDEDERDDGLILASALTDELVDQQQEWIVDKKSRNNTTSWNKTIDSEQTLVSKDDDDDRSNLSLTGMDLMPFDLGVCFDDPDEFASCLFKDIMHIEHI